MEGFSCRHSETCSDCRKKDRRRQTGDKLKKVRTEKALSKVKRPRTAYVFYVQEKHPFFSRSGQKFQEIIEQIHKEWKELSDEKKEIYNIMEKEDREQYKKELIIALSGIADRESYEKEVFRVKQKLHNDNNAPKLDEIVNHKHYEEEGYRVEQKNDVEEPKLDEYFCVVCFDEKRSVALGPCGHLCLCDNCVKILKTCPMCRANIQVILKVYF